MSLDMLVTLKRTADALDVPVDQHIRDLIVTAQETSRLEASENAKIHGFLGGSEVSDPPFSKGVAICGDDHAPHPMGAS